MSDYELLHTTFSRLDIWHNYFGPNDENHTVDFTVRLFELPSETKYVILNEAAVYAFDKDQRYLGFVTDETQEEIDGRIPPRDPTWWKRGQKLEEPTNQ